MGSGISGGWAAKELTEKGLRVLLLERGRNVEHVKDYVNATKAPWEYAHRGGRTQAMEETYPVLKRDYPLNEKNLAFWVNDKESPYTEVKRFDWFRGYQVGGRSLMWGRQSYRLERLRLRGEREGRHRHRLADSLRGHRAVVRSRRAARRHRGLARRTAAAAGRPVPARDAAQLRRGARRGAADASCSADGVASFPAVSQPDASRSEGRAACQYRDACWLGCPYGAYFSTQSSTLPAAAKTGSLTLKPFSIVSEVLYDRDRKRATGVRVLDAVTEPDDRLQGARHLPLRVDAQLDVAAHALGHRRVAGWTRKQLPASSATT